MLVDQKGLDEALNLSSMRIPPSLRVLRLDAENFTDNTGDETLRIHVLLDEATDVEHVSGDDVLELKSRIRENLRKHGIATFVYFKFAKPSELVDVNSGN